MKERIEAMSLFADGTIRQAMRTIDKGGLGVAFLIESQTGRFVGLVTDGDVRRALLGGYGLESPVSQVPRPDPKVAYVGMALYQIAGLLSEPVRVVPLLDDDARVVDLALFDQRMHLPVAEPSLGARELQYVSDCILTGWISSAGKYVKQFEEVWADFCGSSYAVSTSSGTGALHLAILALGIGPGDEVIVPSLTFIATANAVTYTGAKPVFVDSELATWNIDPNEIEKAITSKTKAIIPVHLYGHPADMDPILEIASHYGLAVIEDAAEAHGAFYKGRSVGSIGDAGVFSFYGNKIITTGEGGMVVTDNVDIAEKIRLLRDHGMSPDRRYWHHEIGYNYRLTNLQAAVGVAQMEKAGDILEAKKHIAELYESGLKDVRGISLPPKAKWASSVCWLYSILVDDEKTGGGRDELMAELSKAGIETRPFFPPAHMQPIYNTGQSLPVAEYLSMNGLSLPSAIKLRQEEINHVIDTIVSVSTSPACTIRG